MVDNYSLNIAMCRHLYAHHIHYLNKSTQPHPEVGYNLYFADEDTGDQSLSNLPKGTKTVTELSSKPWLLQLSKVLPK